MVLLLFATYLCGPAFETVDHWDHFPQSGNDIVLNLAAFAICLGAVATLSRLLRGAIRGPRKEFAPLTAFSLEEPSLLAYSHPFVGPSPPGLRI